MGGETQPMSQQPSGHAGPGNDDRPDDLWPDDNDDGAPGGHGGPEASGAHGGAQSALPVPPGWPQQQRPPRRRLHPLAAIALGAALAGAGIALGLQAFSGSPAAPTSSGSRPSYLTPGQPGGNLHPGGNGLPAPPGGGTGGMGSLFMIGKVIAVSSGSITIGGIGHTVTAAITSSTRITGKVTSISGIRAGDDVSAQITESGGKATVAAIQDPAQAPSGIGVP